MYYLILVSHGVPTELSIEHRATCPSVVTLGTMEDTLVSPAIAWESAWCWLERGEGEGLVWIFQCQGGLRATGFQLCLSHPFLSGARAGGDSCVHHCDSEARWGCREC